MPPKQTTAKTEKDSSPYKVRFDTSPGNPNGWRPASEWGTEEDQHCAQMIASLVLDHRRELYAEEKFKPWAFNGGNLVNQKIKQILTKFCKEYGVEMPEGQVNRSPRKRENDEEAVLKTPGTSPKKKRSKTSTTTDHVEKTEI